MVAAPRAPAQRDDAPDDGDRRAAAAPASRRARRRSPGADGWIDDPARARSRWARRPDGFAYDNERPRHDVELAALSRSPRRPVSNASWMRFSEGGGYERREWWSRRGLGVEARSTTSRTIRRSATGHPEAPACHVSWFEADAFARAHGARLPSEAEWERARDLGRRPIARAGSPRASARCGSGPRSSFDGYPGFVAHPYREYSEVFFGERYRVLRGGSWATDRARRHARRSATGTCPQRRQIFAGAAPGEGRVMAAVDRRGRPPRTPDPHRLAPRRRARALARRRRARRAHAALQGAAAQALLRRARRRAVRPDLRAARVLPDARRARDPRSARRRDRAS